LGCQELGADHGERQKIEDHGQGIQLRVFLTGVGCVGKSTIGKKMGEEIASERD
jgi:adenylylsulfate kinase-like enzyme